MKSLSLNAKIWFIIALLSTAAVIISYFGISGMGFLNNGQKKFLANEVKADALTFMMTDHQKQAAIFLRDMIISRSEKDMNEIHTKMLEERNKVFENLESYKKVSSPAGQKLADEYLVLAKEGFAMDDEIAKLAKDNKDDEVRLALEKASDNRTKRNAILAKINSETATEVARAVRESDEAFSQKTNLMVMVSVIAILSGCIVAYLILRALNRAIDEIITTLGENSSHVASAANQISAASQELSQATTEQASSVQQTSSSLAEINSMVQQTSDNAQKSHSFSNTSQKAAIRGREVVEEMLRAIGAINESNDVIRNQIDESNKQISDIVRVISEIENKTKVINDIVFQTKLLSFNASVEAARAGTEGQGFAVVAVEVGNLATMSGNAAKEISDLLDSSIKKVEGIVEDTKSKVGKLVLEGKEKINHGTRVAQDCKNVLEDIVTNVSSVNTLMSEITTACDEQSKGVSEITSAVAELDQVTQQNAATSEQTANAAETLSTETLTLKKIIELLVVTVKGAKGISVDQQIETKAELTHSKKVIPLKPVVKAVEKKSEVKREIVPVSSIPASNDSRFEEA